MFHVEFILRGASLVPLVIKGSVVILFIPLCGRPGFVHLSSVRSSVFGYCSMLSLFSVGHSSFGHRGLGEQFIVRSSWFRRSILGLIIGVFSSQCAMLCGVLICVIDMLGWVFSKVVC